MLKEEAGVHTRVDQRGRLPPVKCWLIYTYIYILSKYECPSTKFKPSLKIAQVIFLLRQFLKTVCVWQDNYAQFNLISGKFTKTERNYISYLDRN